MNKNKLVSILIPIYNREHLIEQTLQSISIQTYKNFECIIVDDGSTDDTVGVISAFAKADPRFKIFIRSKDRTKGANSCRNIAFEKSRGEIIKWFDSDDIMLEDHLQLATHALEDEQIDFVVSESEIFVDDKKKGAAPFHSSKDASLISPENYAKFVVGWITNDFTCKRNTILNTRFNERFRTAGDEYNFFIKYLHNTTAGAFIDRVTTLYRQHDISLSSDVDVDEVKYHTNICEIKYLCSNDMIALSNYELANWFMDGYINHAHILMSKSTSIPFLRSAFKDLEIIKTSTHANYLRLAQLSFRVFGKGYYFIRKARGN
ncbi:glycosyltransferase family 2 protein [Nonlabens ponticola]|uniref:Glycosyltransferase family 2 protein n=1 Tax=Nonlabens ponticola TaxID=2496866 RepID=A0A3S9MXK4_9FLAO|nr:glycosyltransferase family A protein [Nonlabens ponticola]AZQ43867.1 glycosyltransferase family 2 protein [Nonlabens ponticola]